MPSIFALRATMFSSAASMRVVDRVGVGLRGADLLCISHLSGNRVGGYDALRIADLSLYAGQVARPADALRDRDRCTVRQAWHRTSWLLDGSNRRIHC